MKRHRRLELLVEGVLVIAVITVLIVIFSRVAKSEPRSCVAEALAYAYGTGDRYGGGDWLMQCPTRAVLTPLQPRPAPPLPPPLPPPPVPPPQARSALPPLAVVPPPPAARRDHTPPAARRGHAPGPRGANHPPPCPDGCPRDPD